MEYEQNIRPGVLGDGQPGERVRERLQGMGGGADASEGASMMPDLGQDGGLLGSMSMPDDPGPAAAGRTPLVGTVRRSNNMPVVRDQLKGAMG